jgi:hypothetical protein
MPPAKIAAFLHIDVRTLTAFMHRLSAAADAPYPEPPPLPPLPRKEATSPRSQITDRTANKRRAAIFLEQQREPDRTTQNYM